MPISRLRQSLDINRKGNVVLGYGTKNERYMLPNLQFVTDDRLLYHHLQAAGFEHIVFVSPTTADGIYTYDEQSLLFLNLGQDDAPSEILAEEVLPSGWDDDDWFSLEDANGTSLSTGSESTNPPPRMDAQKGRNGKWLAGRQSETTILELLDLISKNESRDRAIVFTDFDNMFTSQQDYAQGFMARLLKLVPIWLRHDQTHRIKLFFLFHQANEDGVVQQIINFPGAALDAYLQGTPDNRSIKSENRFSMANPMADEIEALLHHHRLTRGMTVDWSHWDRIVTSFSNESTQLASLHQRLSVVKELSIDTLKDLGVEITKHRESGLERLQKLIGIEGVKRRMQELVAEIRGMKKAGVALTEGRNLNMVFTGNTGTGKTMVAKLVADIFREEAFLAGGKFTEVKASQLIEEHVGGSAKRTREICEKALNGVLFIDEAYALATESNRNFGEEAVAELIQYMLNERHRFAVIMAGYGREMNDLFELNEGFENRIGSDNTFHFDDYSVEELMAILDLKLGKTELDVSVEIKQIIRTYVAQQLRSDSKKFGNARGIDNIIGTLRSLTYARSEGLTAQNLAERWELRPEEFTEGLAPETTFSAEQELANMIGLNGVKEAVEGIVANSISQKSRGISAAALHMTFEGNPGTGKSTVARLIGQILKDNGVLKSGHLVDATNIKGQYVGATEVRMQEKIKEAQGGILFIDEAYRLLNDQFGKNALDSLVERMETLGNRFVVIAAGYPKPMQNFLSHNEGLKSRFTHNIQFDDYSPVELMDLAHAFIKKDQLRFEEEALNKLSELLNQMYEKRDKNSWGNAREIRKLIQKISESWALRNYRLQKSQPDINQDLLVRTVDIPTVAQSSGADTPPKQDYPTAASINLEVVSSIPDIDPQLLKKGVCLIKLQVPGSSEPSTGTGFFVDNRGTIITAFHVIRDGGALTVEIQEDPIPHDYTVRYVNQAHDFAILSPRSPSLYTPRYFRTLKENTPQIGQEIGQFAYPLGKSIAQTAGYWPGSINNFDQRNGVPIMLHNADSTHGSSGGPIISRKTGSLLGWLTSGFSSEKTRAASFNIAIPISSLYKMEGLKVTVIQIGGSAPTPKSPDKQTQTEPKPEKRPQKAKDYVDLANQLQKERKATTTDVLKLLREGEEKFPDNRYLGDYLAVFLFKYRITLASTQEAIERFKELLKNGPTKKTEKYLLHLLCCERHLKDKPAAAKRLQQLQLQMQSRSFKRLQDALKADRRKPEIKDNRLHLATNTKGVSYRYLFAHTLTGARKVRLIEPYLHDEYQLQNLYDFARLLSSPPDKPTSLEVVTSIDHHNRAGLEEITKLLKRYHVNMVQRYWQRNEIHDRRIEVDDKWIIDLGRGLHIFQAFSLARAHDMQLFDQKERATYDTTINFTELKKNA